MTKKNIFLIITNDFFFFFAAIIFLNFSSITAFLTVSVP